MRQQPEYNILKLEKVSRDIQSRVVKQQSRTYGKAVGYLMTCGRRGTGKISMCDEPERPIWKPSLLISRDGRVGVFGDHHTTRSRGRMQCYAPHSAQYNTILNTYYTQRGAKQQFTWNSSTTESKVMRTPRTLPEARSHGQGHDNNLHDCTTTVSLWQSLEMYRGSMSSELPISHCLGAASEGGFRDIQVIYMYRHPDRPLDRIFNEQARTVVWVAS